MHIQWYSTTIFYCNFENNLIKKKVVNFALKFVLLIGNEWINILKIFYFTAFVLVASSCDGRRMEIDCTAALTHKTRLNSLQKVILLGIIRIFVMMISWNVLITIKSRESIHIIVNQMFDTSFFIIIFYKEKKIISIRWNCEIALWLFCNNWFYTKYIRKEAPHKVHDELHHGTVWIVQAKQINRSEWLTKHCVSFQLSNETMRKWNAELFMLGDCWFGLNIYCVSKSY